MKKNVSACLVLFSYSKKNDKKHNHNVKKVFDTVKNIIRYNLLSDNKLEKYIPYISTKNGIKRI